MGEVKKKAINILIAFYIISHKSSIKTFVKWSIIICWSNLYYLNMLYVNIKIGMWVNCKIVW